MNDIKSYQRSIRMTEETRNYVEKQPGEGFNQKFENMVYFSMKVESDKKAQIKELDKQIQNRKDEITKLNQTIVEKRSVERTLDEIKVEVDRVKILFKKLENAVK